MGRVPQYLVVIYALERAGETPVATGRIAAELDRSPSTATEMVQRLAADGLVEYEPYTGVELTDSGRERARERYETYRTLRRFFRDVLDIEACEREALALAGNVSPVVADRLRQTIVPPNTTSPE